MAEKMKKMKTYDMAERYLLGTLEGAAG